MNNEAAKQADIIDAKCTIDPNCQSRESVVQDTEAGEFACAAHLSRLRSAQSSAYVGPLLVSLTGRRVHYPAVIGQEVTFQTACAPYGRMGARQMRLRFTADSRWSVTCATCLKTQGPRAAA